MSTQIAERIYCLKCRNLIGRVRFNPETDKNAQDLKCTSCGQEFTIQIQNKEFFNRVIIYLNNGLEIYYCPFHGKNLLNPRLISKLGQINKEYACSNENCRRVFEIND